MTLKGVCQTVPVAELEKLVGSEIGVSEWVLVDQERINLFADATLDHQYIHVDPDSARQSPLGSTVAHGFLTLSLIAHLMAKMRFLPDNTTMALNYGLDRVRFLRPVLCDARIRLRCSLLDIHLKKPGSYMLKLQCMVEIEGEERPAMTAEMLVLALVD
jgi:acyl dehydratase